MIKDQELWRKLKGGDKNSLREIYDLQVEYLLQYSLRISRDEALIQDCIHDLFIEIWNRREKLSETTAIRPYLIVALRRKLIKHLQKENKTEELSDHLDFDLVAGAEEMLIQGEAALQQKEKIKAAMDQLSQRQREAIFLKYYEEMDYQEVADAMNINYQSVRNLIFKGMKKLREILVMIIWAIIFFDQI